MEPAAGLVRLIDMWSDAADLFADNDGVATLAQLRAAGVTDRMIASRVDSKELRRVGCGIYRSALHPHSDRVGVRIPVLISGGAADGWAALYWHGLTEAVPERVTATVPRGRRVRQATGYPLDTRRRNLDPLDLDSVDGLAVTAKPLTVLEVCDAREMDRALQTGAVTVDGMAAAIERNLRARGMGEARKIFDVASGDTESEAERLFAELLTLHGITGWHPQMPFHGYAIDFAFPQCRLAVEINGWAFHRSRKRWMSDQNKSNALTSAGWSVLNYSWHHLTEDPEAVITAVAEMIGDLAA
ncbi:DUF559 domain-containing protein [Tsukamurella sputi]|uniref:DUF559 domain-containing protein n=1 Tax=Tsukamurella sputi TaxID=2591848 RepID=A0A5C5RV67_9ACTN|nr:DUF559 domain-containing protein [Tsukamurella sputi]TWS26552.1 DUF559 domain-containing protein [Tsukamurella sputi]